MSRQPQVNSHSRPTRRVANLYGSRRQVVPDGLQSARSRSGIHENQSGRSPSTRHNEQRSHLSPTQPDATGALETPPKRPPRTTIQSTTYTDIETEPDAQVATETVRPTDNSNDEYQDCSRWDQTQSDTEPDAEDDHIPYATGSGLRHWSRIADKQAHYRVYTVPVWTTFRSQEGGLVRRTQVARGRMTGGWAYTPPVLLSSSVARFSSPLASDSATTSGVRSSSPTGESSTPHSEDIWPDTQSWPNTARGVESAEVTQAKALILWYTLFVTPLRSPITLMSEVHSAWLKALDIVADRGNM